jgi:hypothetical protein
VLVVVLVVIVVLVLVLVIVLVLVLVVVVAVPDPAGTLKATPIPIGPIARVITVSDRNFPHSHARPCRSYRRSGQRTRAPLRGTHGAGQCCAAAKRYQISSVTFKRGNPHLAPRSRCNAPQLATLSEP